MRLRDRIVKAIYPLLRYHREVAKNEILADTYGRTIVLLNKDLHEVDDALAQAHWDAQTIYDHAQEIVEIVHRYQGSLNTLAAPDPHEARVRLVIDNFFEQFKDRYDRCG